MVPLKINPRSQLLLCCVCPRSSTRLWWGVDWGWESGRSVYRNGIEVTVLLPEGCPCGRLLSAPIRPGPSAKPRCEVGGTRMLSLGNDSCLLLRPVCPRFRAQLLRMLAVLPGARADNVCRGWTRHPGVQAASVVLPGSHCRLPSLSLCI